MCRWNDITDLDVSSPSCYDSMLWKCCHYTSSFEQLLRYEIKESTDVASDKIKHLETLKRREIEIGLEVLKTFVADLLGRDTLKSKVFEKYFREE